MQHSFTLDSNSTLTLAPAPLVAKELQAPLIHSHYYRILITDHRSDRVQIRLFNPGGLRYSIGSIAVVESSQLVPVRVSHSYILKHDRDQPLKPCFIGANTQGLTIANEDWSLVEESTLDIPDNTGMPILYEASELIGRIDAELDNGANPDNLDQLLARALGCYSRTQDFLKAGLKDPSLQRQHRDHLDHLGVRMRSLKAEAKIRHRRRKNDAVHAEQFLAIAKETLDEETFNRIDQKARE